MRVLTVAHNHPRFHPGGSELFAHALFHELAGRPDIAASYFLAGIEPGYRPESPGTAIQALPGESDVFLFRNPAFNPFLQSNIGLSRLYHDLAALVRELAPDVVFVNHLNHFGVEALQVIRRAVPAARIVLTLHDFYFICANDGQMVRTAGDGLCTRSGIDACRACFPERSQALFHLRELHIKRHLGLVDLFVAPSEFLRRRFVDWGIPEGKIEVIRNGMPHDDPAPVRAIGPDGPPTRFALFGNLRRTKGTLLAAEAVATLNRDTRSPATLDIFGAPLFQPDAFKQALDAAIARSAGAVRLHGGYRREDIPRLMAGVDWVIVPSLWWENAPLVIDEAFHHGRPVLSSDIGGMAEAVRDGVDGLHVPVGSLDAWTDTIRRAASDAGLWQRLAAGIRRPPSVGEAADGYLAAVRRLGGKSEGRRRAKRTPLAAS